MTRLSNDDTDDSENVNSRYPKLYRSCSTSFILSQMLANVAGVEFLTILS